VLIPREIEKRLGLATVLSRHIPDDRDGRRVRHSYSDMTRARMFAIASGHEDCDDLDVLRSDPALKMACGRLPVSGTDLMSQPTLSRLENAPCWRQLARMGLELIDLFCARFERVPRCIVLDIDDTDDAVHGQQQLALFNTHAGGYCFQPIKIFEATTGRPVLSLLRPGKRPSGEEIERILRHVIGRIHRNWPAVEIMVRGDSHFATPEVMDLLEQKRCGYIFGLSTNMRLTEIGRPWSEDVATRRALSKSEKMRRFFQTSYAAASWSKPRKIVARVEASEQGSDIRFIVTNLPRPGKSALRKGLLRARAHGESHQGHEALHPLRPHLLPPLGGQSVPPVPSHGGLLAPARTQGRCAETLNLAHSDLRDHPLRVPQDRCAHRRA
jgi:DDE family transposase